MLTQATLKDRLSYDPETGIFIWKIKSGRSVIGKQAGCCSDATHGYVVIKVDEQSHRGHRLAWLYMTGEFPTQPLDHINGARNDNAWRNLREASRQVNAQNLRKANRRNLSGYLGVSKLWQKRNKPYMANIRVDGKSIFLGTFETAAEAHQHYLQAKRQYHHGCTI